MLFNVNTLRGYHLHGLDGTIGHVKELYFDDHHWTIRYLVADTGNWLTGRTVLISPYAMSTVNRDERFISLALTKKEIENSPSLDSDMPVSRQFEESYYGYYGLPIYWSGTLMWGPYPGIVRDPKGRVQAFPPPSRTWDPNLRSTHDVTGHHAHAEDGDIGHVSDFLVDDETWALRYLVIDTGEWWPGRKVLVSSKWITRVHWSESRVFIGLGRNAIKAAPEYTKTTQVTREYEAALHRHYTRPGYWDADLMVK